MRQLINNDISVVVPEIADYESRRKLLCREVDPIKDTIRLERLNKLNNLGKEGLIYAPITTEVMLKAAALWAWAKTTNQSTASDKELGGDVILAAQSIILSEQLGIYTIIATLNIKHLARYTHAANWREITVEYCKNLRLS